MWEVSDVREPTRERQREPQPNDAETDERVDEPRIAQSRTAMVTVEPFTYPVSPLFPHHAGDYEQHQEAVNDPTERVKADAVGEMQVRKAGDAAPEAARRAGEVGEGLEGADREAQALGRQQE